MSRSNYSDDYEYLDLYRANVHRTIHSKNGRAFLEELASTLDAMPSKRLIQNDMLNSAGEACAMGAVCRRRGQDVSRIDIYDRDQVGKILGISGMLAAEIAYENDEGDLRWHETPEDRWARMRQWVSAHLNTKV